MSQPKTTEGYILEDQKGFESLQLKKDLPVSQLGNHDCLVKIEAVALNYRDLIITKDMYPFPVAIPVIPCSDGFGVITATGENVSEFKVGDKVCTLFNTGHQAGPIDPGAVATGLGGALDGTLRKLAVFPEHALVRAPTSVNAVEASTLTCAPLTAWDALYGLESKALKPGQVVLTQGTGGVALSALQFAHAAGATVISTSSTDEKCQKRKDLGATHTINYKTTPNWGEKAKELSPNGAGVDHVVEIGGPNTMEQSMQAIKMEGVISVIGFLEGAQAEKQPSTLDALTHCCIIRGLLVGSKLQFRDMNAAIDANKIKPIVDKTFKFEEAKEAYQYQWDQKHIGKVVISVQ